MSEEQNLIEKRFEIMNKQGLHARPAALFVQTANQFECEVEVLKDDMTVNGKSIMGIMMLAAEAGSVVTVRIRGVGAQQAFAAIQKLFETNFGEVE
jgi:phosphocarrier protein